RVHRPHNSGLVGGGIGHRHRNGTDDTAATVGSGTSRGVADGVVIGNGQLGSAPGSSRRAGGTCVDSGATVARGFLDRAGRVGQVVPDPVAVSDRRGCAAFS